MRGPRRGSHLWRKSHCAATHLPVLVTGVKVVKEAAQHLLLCPLPAAHLRVGAAAVYPSEVIHGYHAVPTAVQLGKGSCNDGLPGPRHGGLGTGSSVTTTGALISGTGCTLLPQVPRQPSGGLTRSARRNSSKSSVPLPSRSQRLHRASASARSSASPSSARPRCSSTASREWPPSRSRRRKNLQERVRLDGVLRHQSLGGARRAPHLARPWMPEDPRARHCARSFSTVASTASMLGRVSE